MNIENPLRDFWERFGLDLDSSVRSVIQSFQVWTWSPQMWSSGVSVAKKIAKIDPDGDQVFKSELVRAMRDVQYKRFNSAKEFNNVVQHIQLRHQLRQQQQEKLKRNLTDSKILKVNSNIRMEKDMSEYQISEMATMILEKRREDKDSRIPKDKSVGWAATKGLVGGTIAGGIAQKMRRADLRRADPELAAMYDAGKYRQQSWQHVKDLGTGIGRDIKNMGASRDANKALKAAKKAFDANPTAANKTALTKATAAATRAKNKLRGSVGQYVRQTGHTIGDASASRRAYDAAVSGVKHGGHWKKIAAGTAAAALATGAYLHNRRNRKLRDKKIEASFQNKTN
jgi:hypothetical protein